MSFAHSKSIYRAEIRNMSLSRTNDQILIEIKMPNPNQEPPAPNQDLRDMYGLCTFKFEMMNQNLEQGVSRTSDHKNIRIKMPNPNQEPPTSSKAPNEDLKDMDVLCNFKIKIESHNFDHWYIKDQ